VWFAQLVSKVFLTLDRLLPSDPALRLVAAFVFMWTWWSGFFYLVPTLGSRTSRSGHQVNHAHGHLIAALLVGLGFTVLCSIVLLVVFTIRSDDS
jgi:hypothetical protein